MFQGKRDQLLNTGDRLSKIKTELCLLDSATSRSLESLRQVVLVEVKVSIFGTGDRGSRQVFGEIGQQVKRKMGP